MKKIFFVLMIAVSLAGCELFDSLDDNTPTRERMQGNWTLTKATDEQGGRHYQQV